MQMNDFKSFEEFLLREKVFQRYGISRMGVFGSLARGDKNIKDIDILIEDEYPDYNKLIALKNYLETALGMKVDVVIKKFADPIILYRAMKEIKYAALHKE